MKNLILIPALILSLSACMKVKDKDEDKNEGQSQESPKQSQSVDDTPSTETKIKDKILSVRIDALPEPYKYEAKIFVEYATAPLLIRKTETQSSQSWVLNYQPGETITDSVVSGKTYSYEVVNPTNSSGVVDKLQVTVPQDFVLLGNEKAVPQILDSKTKQGLEKSKRIFLGRDLVLVTQGQDLTLQADELISQSATILTFLPGASAKVNQVGRPGGRITVFAKKAKGLLKFELRGENGGPGSAGRSQPQGVKGKEGKAYFAGSPWTCKLTTQAGPGADGLRGGNGFNGQQGGATGSLILKIEEEQGFDFRVERFQGMGGQGGAGGIGGDGGPGGDYGATVLMKNLCSKLEGAPGAKGADGAKGRDALPGVIERVCVKRSWDREPNCY